MLGIFFERNRGRAIDRTFQLLDHFRLSRYSRSARRSSGARGLGGMRTPGFNFCGSTIQPARWPIRLGIVPAAIFWREAMWVRLGPSRAPASVPWMVWQVTQVLAMN